MTNDKIVALSVIARDEATATLRRVDAALNGLTGRANTTGDAFKGLRGAMLGLGAASAAFIAASAIGDFFKRGIQGAIEEEASIKRLTTALRANVPAWDENRSAIDAVVASRMQLGFTDDDLRSSLTLLVGATNDVNRALSIQQTAMDLARFKGIGLGEATEALVKVEGGRYRLLAALGIELEKGATREQALAAVQKLAAGQAQEQANTTAGAMRNASIAIEELAESIGTHLLPLLGDLASGLTNDVIPAMNDFVEASEREVEAVQDFIGNLRNAVLDLASFERAQADAASESTALEQEARNLARTAAITAATLADAGAAAQDTTAEVTDLGVSTDAAAFYMNRFIDAQRASAAAARSTIGPILSQTGAINSLGVEAAITTRNLLAMNSAVRFAAGPRDPNARNLDATFGQQGPLRQTTPRLPSFGGGGGRRGGGGGSSAVAAAARAEAEATKAAYAGMREAGRKYYDLVHERNVDVIDAAHEAARERIDAAHRTANAQIKEAQRAANAEIAAGRRAVDAALAERRRLNAAGVTAAEQAQNAIELARQRRDLEEQLADAAASGDSRSMRNAQEAIQSFDARQGIDALREQQAIADAQAEKEAQAAQAELDARQEAADRQFAEQQAAEDAQYERQKADEDARYAKKKADEDARWQLVRDKFDDHVDALEESKRATVGLALIETRRYLQEQLKQLKESGASRFEIAGVQREIDRLPALAGGLAYVPSDNYVARLHRGEAVLPAGEANAWRSGGGISVGAITINGANKTTREMARELLQETYREANRQRVTLAPGTF